MISVIHYETHGANAELWTDKGQVRVLINCMNCFGQFSKPEQKVLKSEFPSVIGADRKTQRGDCSKMGTVTKCTAKKYGKDIDLYNAYIMFDWGSDKNSIRYDALRSCLMKIAEGIDDAESVCILDPGYNLNSTDNERCLSIIEEVLGTERTINIFCDKP